MEWLNLEVGRDDGFGAIAANANDLIDAEQGSELNSLASASGSVVLRGATVGTYTNINGQLSLTFNGFATTQVVQDVLNHLTYSSTITEPGALDEDNVTLRVLFNDQNINASTDGLGISHPAGMGQDQGSGGSELISSTINIQINRLPVATPDSNTLPEGISSASNSTVGGNVLNDATPETDQDIDDANGRDDALTIAGVIAGTAADTFAVNLDGFGIDTVGDFGSLLIDQDGEYVYTLDNSNGSVQAIALGESLVDTFTFTVSDGNGGYTSNTLDITITGTNDAPQLLTSSTDTVELTTGSALPLLRVAIPAEGVEAGDSLQLTYLGDSQTPHQLTDADINNGFVDVQLTLSLQDADGNLNDVPVKWIDWTTQSGTMVSGAFNTETGVVNASLTSTSSYAGVQLSGGTNYFNPTSPYISDGVAAPTSSDIIRFNPAGWRTLSFDSEVRNLYFAFVSMNGNGYRFDRDFDILSQTDNPDTPEDEGGGNGYWGSGWAEKVEVIIDGQTYWELRAVNGEPHGVIQFKGAFSDLTWENPVSEIGMVSRSVSRARLRPFKMSPVNFWMAMMAV